MADVDIYSFGDQDKTDTHPDETGEIIPLNPEGVLEGSPLEKQNKKRHLEE